MAFATIMSKKSMNLSEISRTKICSLKKAKMCEVPYLSNGDNNFSSESNLFTYQIPNFSLKMQKICGCSVAPNPMLGRGSAVPPQAPPPNRFAPPWLARGLRAEGFGPSIVGKR